MSGRTLLAEIPGGVRVGKHAHPGEEVGYALEGTLRLRSPDQPATEATYDSDATSRSTTPIQSR